VASRLFSLLGLFQLVVEFFVFLEALEVNAIPISVSGSDAETERGGEVDPETFPELSGDGSDGHLV